MSLGEIVLGSAPSQDQLRWAGAILVTQAGTVLVQQRDQRAHINPGKIGLFGGQCLHGERYIDCMRRELLEELELQAERYSIRVLGSFVKATPSAGKSAVSYVFVVEGVPKGELVLHEGDEILELTPQEVIQHPLATETTREALAQYLAKLTKPNIS